MFDVKWLIAIRPKTLTAAVVPVSVGGALASFNAPILLLFCFLTAIFIQIGTNLVNDAIDFQRGADTQKRLGPQRVTQMGWLTQAQVMQGAWISFLLAALTSVPLVFKGGLGISSLIGASILSGYFYTGGPKPLAYLGLGDLFVWLFFGLGATVGVYYLQVGVLSIDVFVAGSQVGFLATVLIAINNLRDIETDRICDKKTLAVRFGATFAKYEILTFLALPFVLQFYWHFFEPFYILPLALFIAYRVIKEAPSQTYIPKPKNQRSQYSTLGGLQSLILEPFSKSKIRFLKLFGYNQLLGLAALLQLVFGALFIFGFFAH